MKLAFHVVLSRAAGPAGYGAYTLGFNLVAFVQNFAVVGLDQALVRFIPAYRARREQGPIAGLLLMTWAVGTIASVLVGGLLFLSSDQLATHVFHASAMGGVLRLFAVALTFFTWIVLGAATAQAYMKPRLSVLIQDLVFPGAALAILLIVGGVTPGLGAALVAFLGAAILAGCLGVAFAARQLRNAGRLEFRIGDWSRFAGAMTVIEASAFVFTGLSPIAVAFFGGVRQAGLYSAALALVAQSSILYAGIAVVVPPTLADLFARGAVGEAGALLRAVTRWLALLSQPFFIVLVALGSVLLGVFGPDFRGAMTLLLVLAGGAAVTTVTVFTGYALVCAGRQTVDMWNHVGLLVVALAGYPVAAALGGVLGVAIFTAALNVLSSAVKTVQVRWLLGIRIWDRHLGRVLALGTATLGLYLTGSWIGATATMPGRIGWLAVCLGVYAAAAIASLSAEDRQLLDAVRILVRERR
jgi:O-antigen/teichoic acid export membrane protein